MDEDTVRLHLHEIRARLAIIEQERDVLTNLLKGYEGWLRLRQSGNGQGRLLPDAPVRTASGRTAPKGSISLRKAIVQVLKDARGEPLHAKEIWQRAKGLGASTGAEDPTAVVDYAGYSLKRDGQPVEKSGPRTWRWAGPIS